MENAHTNHTLICENRQKLTLTGVQKVESSTPTQFSCVINGNLMTVLGKNLHIKKLDLQAGTLELDGEINSIKYLNEKKNFLKRLFK